MNMSLDNSGGEPDKWGPFIKIRDYKGYRIYRMPNNKYCIVKRDTATQPSKTIKVGLPSAQNCINYIDKL